jgi:hypothetical protein
VRRRRRRERERRSRRTGAARTASCFMAAGEVLGTARGLVAMAASPLHFLVAAPARVPMGCIFCLRLFLPTQWVKKYFPGPIHGRPSSPKPVLLIIHEAHNRAHHSDGLFLPLQAGSSSSSTRLPRTLSTHPAPSSHRGDLVEPTPPPWPATPRRTRRRNSSPTSSRSPPARPPRLQRSSFRFLVDPHLTPST